MNAPETTKAEVLYDVRTEEPPVRGDIRGGIAGCVLGVLMLLLVVRRRERAPKVFAMLWIVAWAAGTAYNVSTIRRNHAEAGARLSSGEVETVEGVVADLHPAPLDGKGYETFRVNDRTFVLGQEQKAAGLKLGASQGGPVREGRKLRITYRGKSILRVESIP